MCEQQCRPFLLVHSSSIYWFSLQHWKFTRYTHSIPFNRIWARLVSWHFLRKTLSLTHYTMTEWQDTQCNSTKLPPMKSNNLIFSAQFLTLNYIWNTVKHHVQTTNKTILNWKLRALKGNQKKYFWFFSSQWKLFANHISTGNERKKSVPCGEFNGILSKHFSWKIFRYPFKTSLQYFLFRFVCIHFVANDLSIFYDLAVLIFLWL